MEASRFAAQLMEKTLQVVSECTQSIWLTMYIPIILETHWIVCRNCNSIILTRFKENSQGILADTDGNKLFWASLLTVNRRVDAPFFLEVSLLISHS